MDKFVVIANWDSCDSVVYGLFDSIEDAKNFAIIGSMMITILGMSFI